MTAAQKMGLWDSTWPTQALRVGRVASLKALGHHNAEKVPKMLHVWGLEDLGHHCSEEAALAFHACRIAALGG